MDIAETQIYERPNNWLKCQDNILLKYFVTLKPDQQTALR